MKSTTIALSLGLGLLLVSGCLKQPAAQPPPPPAAHAPAATPPPAAPVNRGESWGCLYTTDTGIFWVSAAADVPAAQLISWGAGEDATYFDISPDGTRLALVTELDGCDIVDVASGDTISIYPPERRAGPVAWSPQGDRLAYVQNGVLSVRLADGWTVLMVDDDQINEIGWSRDGEHMAYGRRDKRDRDLGLSRVGASGGSPTRLVKGTGDVFGVSSISWAPNGKFMAFLHAWEGGALCFVRPDGRDYRPDLGPAWGPLRWLADSSAVVYVAMENEVETVGIARCTTGGKPVVIVPGRAVAFDMLPSGRLLAIQNPADKDKPVIQVSLRAQPQAEAVPDWSQDVPGRYATGMFQRNGEFVALHVQNDAGEGSLWMAPPGQELVRRADKVQRLLGCARRPRT